MRVPVAWMLALAALGCGGPGGQDGGGPGPGSAEAGPRTVIRPQEVEAITWASDSIRFQQGNILYLSRCARCHGEDGSTPGPYARYRSLEPPEITILPGGEAGEQVRIRDAVLSGHEDGMPAFGDGRLSARDISALTYYVVNGLGGDP